MFKTQLIELRKQIGKLVGQFAEQVTKDGKTLVYNTEVLAVEDAIYQYDDKGVMVPAEDGTYVLEDGTEVTVVNGIVTAIKPSTEEVPTEEVPAEEMAEIPAPVVEEVTPEVTIEDEVSTPEQDQMVELITGLMTKITELTDIINGMQTNMSALETRVGVIGKFTKAEKITEMPELNDGVDKTKLTRAERILRA